jgi:hypothetical protein
MKKEEWKPNFNEGNLGINPFVSELTIVVSTLAMKSQYRKDKDGDIVPLTREVESDASCKVYNSSSRRLKMCQLSSGAKSLLLWIIYEAESGKDFLWVNRIRYQRENEISSPNTYRSAINELIENGWVCRTKVAAVYWINPALFFNGNRVVKFSKNVVERELKK